MLIGKDAFVEQMYLFYPRTILKINKSEFLKYVFHVTA